MIQTEKRQVTIKRKEASEHLQALTSVGSMSMMSKNLL